MTFWRLTIASVLIALIVVPLALPIVTLGCNPTAWIAWGEGGRVLGLLWNTLVLTGGTLALAMPVGIGLAILLYRTDVPLRRAFRFVLLFAVLTPLPLFASGWQAVLGSGGWLPLPVWNAPRDVAFGPDTGAWTPWGQGIGSAIWIHAMAAIPWVVLLTGQGLLGVERSLEEDALTVWPAWRVLLRVSLPRAGAAIAAAALWVALQTAGEIAITDMMQVRTYAEEVYTQLVAPEAHAPEQSVARAVAIALPLALLLTGLVLIVSGRLERRLPAGDAQVEAAMDFRLGHWKAPAALLVAVFVGVLVLIPVGSLVWRAGVAGAPPNWGLKVVAEHLRLVAGADSGDLVRGVLVAATAAILISSLALVCCWAAAGTRWPRRGLFALAALAWALPGPLVGIGLKDTIRGLLDHVDNSWLARALWYGPSPVPVVWAYLLRLFPYAVALLWPVVRRVSPQLREAAAVDGASPALQLRHVVWPHAARAFRLTIVAVCVPALGELAASKLVSMAGWQGQAELLFTRMHYGITNDLAAECLLLAALVGLGAVLIVGALRAGGRGVG